MQQPTIIKIIAEINISKYSENDSVPAIDKNLPSPLLLSLTSVFGDNVGLLVGEGDGLLVDEEGIEVGVDVGLFVGMDDGLLVNEDGTEVGVDVGLLVGMEEGLLVNEDGTEVGLVDM